MAGRTRAETRNFALAPTIRERPGIVKRFRPESVPAHAGFGRTAGGMPGNRPQTAAHPSVKPPNSGGGIATGRGEREPPISTM